MTQAASSTPVPVRADFDWKPLYQLFMVDTASPGDPNGTGKSQPTSGGAPGATTTTRALSNTPTTSRKPTRFPNEGAPTPTTATRSQASTSSSGLTDTARTIGVGAAVLTTPLLALGAFKWRRRRTRRLHGNPRDRVLGAWSHTTEVFARVGIRRRPSTTAMEFALREAPARGVGNAGPALLELARIHSTALYGDADVPDDDAIEAWACVRSIEKSIIASLPNRRRRLTVRLRV